MADPGDGHRPGVELGHGAGLARELHDLVVGAFTFDSHLDQRRVGSPDLEAGRAVDDGCAEPAGRRVRGHPAGSGARNTAASGGNVSTIDWWNPCESTGTLVTPPKLPTPLPP